MPATRLNRYLLAEISHPLLAISLVLLAIFISASTANYLTDAAAGLIPPATVLRLVLLKSFLSLETLLPIALYLAVVGGLGRLYADAEVTALHAAGLSERWLLVPVLLLSLACALLVGGLTLYGRPWAYQQTYWLVTAAEAALDFDKLEAGRFYESSESGRTIFVEQINHRQNSVEGIFLKNQRDDVIQVVYARRARQPRSATGVEPVLLLTDGHFYELDPAGNRDVAVAFGELTLRLDEAEVKPSGYRRKAAPSATLAVASRPDDIAEWQWRLSRPLATLLLGLLGVPLARATPRQGKYARTLLAILIYLGYFNLSAMARTWLEQGWVPPLPGLWWVEGLLTTLLLGLLLAPAWRFRGDER